MDKLQKVQEALEANLQSLPSMVRDCGHGNLHGDKRKGRFMVPNPLVDATKEALAELKAFREGDKGELSDGYHTFNELYEHRHALFANVVNQEATGWKSKLHDDGTMFDGWFIAGISTRDGDVTYHLPLEHWELFQCKELDKAPKWDGHTSDDVINRLKGIKKADNEELIKVMARELWETAQDIQDDDKWRTMSFDPTKEECFMLARRIQAAINVIKEKEDE